MVIGSLYHRQLMIPQITLTWGPGGLGADPPPPSHIYERVWMFVLPLKPSWTWLIATRITLWVWMFRLSSHARGTSQKLGLMTVVCCLWHCSPVQNKASCCETWNTPFPINNWPYIIDNIVPTYSTFMMVNAHDAHWPVAVSRCMVECLLFYAFLVILYSQGSIAWSLKNVW